MRKTSRDALAEVGGGANPGRGRTMTRVRWTIAGGLFGLGLAAWAGAGRDRRGPAEADAGTIDGAVRTITQGVQDASDTVRDKFTTARASARNLGIEQQITTRLRQDKTLEANRIEVHVEDESTAVLKGLVPDDESKEKAVQLTRDTRGVLKVIDHLAVPPPPRVITSPREDDGVPAVATRSRSVR